MRIKILRGVSEVRFKKTRLLHVGNVENHLVRNFLRNGRLRVNQGILAKHGQFKILGLTDPAHSTLSSLRALLWD